MAKNGSRPLETAVKLGVDAKKVILFLKARGLMSQERYDQYQLFCSDYDD